VAFALFLFAILGNHIASSEENPKEIEESLQYIFFDFPSGNTNSNACSHSLQSPIVMSSY
jgi:hypothetical protein